RTVPSAIQAAKLATMVESRCRRTTRLAARITSSTTSGMARTVWSWESPIRLPASALMTKASARATRSATPAKIMSEGSSEALEYKDHKGSQQPDFNERLQRPDQI